MSALKAIIDLGSLKAKVMIFEKKTLNIVFKTYYLTLLGDGVHETKRISDKALGLLEDALQKLRYELERHGVQEIIIIATEALRLATNKHDVEILVAKYLPNTHIRTILQDEEGELLFSIVSKHFPHKDITIMDIGGGSIQVLNGKYMSEKNTLINHRYYTKTGVYTLQQKYSSDNNKISNNFDVAKTDVRNEFGGLKASSEILVFGSSMMKDFIKECAIQVYTDTPFLNHEFYTTVEDLWGLLTNIRKYSPSERRKYFYPNDPHFVHGADYLLLNLLIVADKVGAKYIYPTNFNSSYGLV